MNELDNPVVEGPKPEEPAQPVLPAAILPPQPSGATSNDLEFLEEFDDKTTPSTEGIKVLEKKMDEYLGDIKVLLDSRNRGFENTFNRKHRLPVVPALKIFQNYKEVRQEKLNDFNTSAIPKRKETNAKLLANELETFWDIEGVYTHRQIHKILISFYQEKSRKIQIENNLLVSRWIRCLKASINVEEFKDTFITYQTYLQNEYTDSIERYERLTEKDSQLAKEEAEIEQRRLVEKKEAERKGAAIFAFNMGMGGEDPKLIPPSGKSFKDALKKEKSFGFQVGDLTIYLRWLFSNNRMDQIGKIFATRAKMLSHSEKNQIIIDYHNIRKLTPSTFDPSTLNGLEGIEGFIENAPPKILKIEDFFTEFDYLVYHYKIQTPIGRGDGRPFMYEVDALFKKQFPIQAKNWVLPLYEDAFITTKAQQEIIEQNSPDKNKKKTVTASDIHTPWNAFKEGGGEAKFGSLGDMLESSFKRQTQNLKTPRLRKSEWIASLNIFPRLQQWQESQIDFLKSAKELDFEILYELDLIKSNDIQFTQQRLKESAKRIIKPENYQNRSQQNIPTSAEHESESEEEQEGEGGNFNTDFDDVDSVEDDNVDNSESGKARKNKSFQFGMLLPDGREKIEVLNVLNAKKQTFGNMVRKNEELRAIEQELMEVDPVRAKILEQQIVQTTINNIFAEHEIYSYVQLRHLRIRDFRSTILGHLNFYRSIQKRVHYDLQRIKNSDVTQSILDPINQNFSNIFGPAATCANMWKNQEFFEPPIPENMNNKNSSRYHEDSCTISDNKITIRDENKVPFVYDSALEDLKFFEMDAAKILTNYINKGISLNAPLSRRYADELRNRLSDCRVENMRTTYLNPNIDRAQILFELYEHETVFGNAKVQLINAYMEIYEHLNDVSSISKISQIITDIVALRPNLDLDSSSVYFSQQYTLQTKALELQTRLILDMSKYLIEEYRVWSKRYYSKTNKKFEAADDGIEEVNKYNVNTGAFKDTPLAVGLPPKKTDEVKQMMTMHHAALPVELVEFFPGLQVILDIYDTATVCAKEVHFSLEYISPNETFITTAIECITWKHLNVVWKAMEAQRFQTFGEKSPNVSLDDDMWFENPLLADVLLDEHYRPSNPGDGKIISGGFAPYTCFNDPAFQNVGCELLCQMLKLFVGRKRLFLTWAEEEFWREIFERQSKQMGLKPKAFIGRMSAIRFDVLDTIGDLNIFDDDEIEEPITNENGEDIAEPDSTSAVSFNFGPLAVQEIDEMEATIKVSSLNEIFEGMKPGFIAKIIRALKMKKGEKVAAETKKTIDYDYKVLISKITPKKKYLRKWMSQEYMKEQKKFPADEVNILAKADNMLKMKHKLIDWYFTNMTEIVQEEFEKTEFAIVMIGLRSSIRKSISTEKMLFKISKIEKHADYYEIPENQAVKEEANVMSTQEVVHNDERLSKLWYFPHLTEIILAKIGSEKLKTPLDVTQNAYRNSQVWSKSTNIHILIYDIFKLVNLYAHLIQGNRNNSKEALRLRVSEFLISNILSIKKELLHQGTKAEYNRVEPYLAGKWRVWAYRVRLAVNYSLWTKPIYKALNEIRGQKQAVKVMDTTLHLQPMKYNNMTTIIRSSYSSSPYYFFALDEETRKICDAKVLEVDICFSDFMQSATNSIGENQENVNKMQVQFLLENIRLLAFRMEYFRLILKQKNISDSSQSQGKVDSFFRLYKSRVIIGAIRLYHAQGARGNGKPGMIFKSPLVEKPFKIEGNVSRLAHSSFDSCQIAVLKQEISRLYTNNVLEQTKAYFEQLSDERTSRLFKTAEMVEIVSMSGESENSFQISEADYNAKSKLLQNFVNELYSHNLNPAPDMVKDAKKNSATKVVEDGINGLTKINVNPTTNLPDSSEDLTNIFSCTKSGLSTALTNLGLELSNWQQYKKIERNTFVATNFARLMDLLALNDKVSQFMSKERITMKEQFESEVRLSASAEVWKFLTEMTALSEELSELKKQRKLEEKKMREKIIDEYDNLVRELVQELHIMHKKFNEYRINTVNEVKEIMSDTKKEELHIVVDSMEVPEYMKQSAIAAIEQENTVQTLNDENYELQMALMKLRTMYKLKEQGLRSIYDRKIRMFSEDNHTAEEKLWDSYRDSEAREVYTKKILLDLQKKCLVLGMESERKKKELGGKSLRNEDSLKAHTSKINELQEKLRAYEGVNIRLLVHELTEKTRVMEDLIEEKQQLETYLKDLGYSHLLPAKAKKEIQRPYTSSGVRFNHYSINSKSAVARGKSAGTHLKKKASNLKKATSSELDEEDPKSNPFSHPSTSKFASTQGTGSIRHSEEKLHLSFPTLSGQSDAASGSLPKLNKRPSTSKNFTAGITAGSMLLASSRPSSKVSSKSSINKG